MKFKYCIALALFLAGCAHQPAEPSVDLRVPDRPEEGYGAVDAGEYATCAVEAKGGGACWWSDGADVGAPPESEEFQEMAVGMEVSCGIRRSGGVVCWGPDGEASPGPTGDDFVALEADARQICGRRADGSIDCWGADGAEQAVSPPASLKAADFGLGDDHGCAVTPEGTLTCWGSETHGEATPPDGQEFAGVTAGRHHACGRRTDGRVRCWGLGSDPEVDEGQNDYDQGVPPDRRFIAIDAGAFHTCGVAADRRVVCWGGDGSGEARAPEDFKARTVAAGGEHSCATGLDGELRCWGDRAWGEGDVSLEALAARYRAEYEKFAGRFDRPTHYRIGRIYIPREVDGEEDGAVTPRAQFEEAKRRFFENGESFDEVARADFNQSYAVDMGWRKAENMNRKVLEAIEGKSIGEVAVVESEFAFQLVKLTGRRRREGPPLSEMRPAFARQLQAAEERDPETSSLEFTAYAAGAEAACGTSSEGKTYCWGSGPVATEAPGREETFEMLRASLETACGLTEEGALHCWGSNGPIPERVELAGGRFASFDVGRRHVCGLDQQGGIHCRGLGSKAGVDEAEEGDFDQAVPPEDGDGAFSQVATGGFHTCGLRESGAIDCWGDDRYGQASPPEGEDYDQVIAGVFHSCARVNDGAVRCWGLGDGETSNQQGGRRVRCSSSARDPVLQLAVSVANLPKLECRQAKAPKEARFRRIWTGFSTTCGLTEAGAIDCWGDFPEADEQVGAARLKDLSVGHRQVCGRDDGGRLRCWSDGDDAKSRVPSGRKFQQVVEREYVVCGVDDGGRLTCWERGGADMRVAGEVPGGRNIASVDVHGDYACAVTTERQIVCWGEPMAVSESAPRGRRFTDVELGEGYGCARTVDGEEKCWGEKPEGQSAGASSEGRCKIVGGAILCRGGRMDRVVFP